ncbi:MAG: holdfast anchoring protein HfaA [Alphaproteobacteria bacterium]
MRLKEWVLMGFVAALAWAALGAPARAGGGYDDAATYNTGIGMAPGEENAPISGSTRDENGNKVFVNGVMTGATHSAAEGVHRSGVGFAGPGGTASATAIGNALNVVVNGSWNTVIVDSKQVNKGDQTATLNGDIDF